MKSVRAKKERDEAWRRIKKQILKRKVEYKLERNEQMQGRTKAVV